MFKQAVLATAVSVAVVATAPQSHAATVLTLEGGLVGLQHILHFTPLQLGGDLCKAPDHCRPVDYTAFPADAFTARGAAEVEKVIGALPADEQVVLFGHSQGGQVIYADLRRWAADPANAPDPARLSWVSIGNPENPYGGRRVTTEGPGAPWLPTDTAYTGTEVIRQYDGWADWPDDTTNLVAVANAVVGMFTTHTDYWKVDLADPGNVRHTPDLAGGEPGHITYVWVPNKTLPLVAWTGPFAPALDKALRPIVERGYSRPVDIPDPAGAATARASVRETVSVKRATGRPAPTRKPAAVAAGASGKRPTSRATSTAQSLGANGSEHRHRVGSRHR